MGVSFKKLNCDRMLCALSGGKVHSSGFRVDRFALRIEPFFHRFNPACSGKP